jgi:predicted Rossmann fold flavoprotein
MFTKKNHYTIAIIGAGASGLLSSILLAKKGYSVLLLEQNNKVGKKIVASGNGRCNISNTHPTPQRFYSQNPAFIEKVLYGYGADDIATLFTSMGLPLIEEKEGKLFPASLQASSVVALLEYEAQNSGVTLLCNHEVTKVTKEKSFSIQTTQACFTAEHLIIATGSTAAPKLGGSFTGQQIAHTLGHTLIANLPSLVPLCSDASWVKTCSGVKHYGKATLYVNGEHRLSKEGDLLFTNYGISGLAILDLSREVSLALHEHAYCELSLDLMPHLNKQQLFNYLEHHINPTSHKPIALWLQSFMNKKLIPHLLHTAHMHVTKECELNTKILHKLLYALKHLTLPITQTRGFAYAEVATGGVDTTEINPTTMQSTLLPNLYFTGEVLDVVGDRGGFNFYFAWVSAMRLASHFP